VVLYLSTHNGWTNPPLMSPPGVWAQDPHMPLCSDTFCSDPHYTIPVTSEGTSCSASLQNFKGLSFQPRCSKIRLLLTNTSLLLPSSFRPLRVCALQLSLPQSSFPADLVRAVASEALQAPAGDLQQRKRQGRATRQPTGANPRTIAQARPG
jgi:hypothetical protein